MSAWKDFQNAYKSGKVTQQSQIRKTTSSSKSAFQQYVENQKKENLNAEYTYPEKMTIPSTPGYYSFPHKHVQREQTRLSNLIAKDKDLYDRGVKNTVAPFYQKAMDAHRSQQSAYSNKGYPGLPGINSSNNQQSIVLEKYLEKTPEAVAAFNKYSREVLPYATRALETSKATKEYNESVVAAYDDWKSRVREPHVIRKDIDALADSSDPESAAKRTLLEEELNYSQVFSFGDKYKSGDADVVSLGDDVRTADARVKQLQREIQDDQYILENWPGQQPGHTPTAAMVSAQGEVRERISANQDKLAGILSGKDIRKEEYIAYWTFIYQEMNEADADSKSIKTDVAYNLNGVVGDVYNILRYLNNPMSDGKPVEGDVEIDGVNLNIGELSRMTDNEKSMFVYLCNRGETDKAMTLLKDLTVYLPARFSADIAEAIDYPVLREAVSLVNGTALGLRDIGYGAASMFVDLDAPEVTEMEYMQQYWQEKHKGSLAGYTTSAFGTIGRMAPTVAAAAINPAAAAMTTFAGSMGNSYAQARREGFNHQQAWLQSAMTGAAEAGLQAVLGGAGGIIEGSLTGLAKTKVGKLVGKLSSNKAVKFFADFVGDIGGEILEENLQLFLEPAFKMFASMSDHYDSPSLDDILETSIVTAISSAVFFGANQISESKASKAQEEYTKLVKKTMHAWSQMENVPVLHNAAQAIEQHFAENDSITPREYNDIVRKYTVTKPYVESEQAKHSVTAKTETEQRADLVQAANPNATVIRSEAVQAYINTGKVTLKNAQKAASVLDAISSGEKVELSNNEIDSLMLTTTAGSEVASKILGIEVPRFAEKSTARTQFRSIMAKYAETRAESQNTAPVATEQLGGQIVQPDAEPSVAPTYSAPAEAYESTFHDDEQSAEPIVDTAPEVASTDSDFVAMSAGLVVPQNQKADVTSVYESPAQSRMGYTAFAEKYRQYFNKNATDNELGTAYHRYSNPDSDGEYYGVRPSAEVFNLPEETVRAIDELGKLFGLDISFDDLGNDNGYYVVGTNKVVMDIKPKRGDADSAFLFTASHELGHAIRDRIGMEAWSAFEKYAVAAMGGEKAVQAKQKQNAVYRNPTEAREDVACDFLGKLMSDKNTLDTFCKAVEKGQFNAEYAKGIGGLMQKIVDRINSAKLSKAIRKWWGKDIANAKDAAQAILKAADAALKVKENTAENVGSVKKSFKGYDPETGRGIYESNFPKGTPKSAKAKVILDYIQNVWSKKPISLLITNRDGSIREIKAEFDPTYDPNPQVRTDASKLMGGNRQGTSSDQRVTLDLASDYYQILSESVYNYSKDESGKKSDTHKDVKQWHYFVNDIFFIEYGEEEARPYGVTINIKEKPNGTFVYSYSAELQEKKGTNTRQTLHADVTPTENSGGNVHSHIDKLTETAGKVNTQKTKKSVKTNADLARLDADYMSAVESGDMETAQRMVEEAANVAFPNSKIRDENGNLVPVYHGTMDMFYVFDTSVKGGVNGTAEGFGIYTTDNPEVTAAYGDRQIKMYANITKPARSDRKTITTRDLIALIKNTCIKQAQKAVEDGEYDSSADALLDTWVSNYVYTYDIGMERAYRETAGNILRMNDSDMAIIQEVMTGMAIRDYAEANIFYRDSLTPTTGFDGFIAQWENKNTGEKSNIILALNSNQLKSADPVTYDDNGNVIPMSERFNEKKTDIRYSKKDTGIESYEADYGTELRTQTQIDRAKERSDARADRERMYSKAEENAKEVDAKLTQLHEQEQADKRKKLERDMFTPPNRTSQKELFALSRSELHERVAMLEKQLSSAILFGKNMRNQRDKIASDWSRTDGKQLDTKGLYSIVKKEMQKHDNPDVSHKNVSEMTNRLAEIFSKAAQMYENMGADSSAEYIYQAGMEFAKDVVESGISHPYGTKTDTLYETYAEARSYLRSTTILLPRQFAKDVSADFSDWRRSYWGRLNVKLVDSGKGNVDTVYNELASMCPWFGNGGALSEPDMLIQIGDALNKIYDSKDAGVSYAKAFTDAEMLNMEYDIVGHIFSVFGETYERPRLKSKMDKLLDRHNKHIERIKSEARQAQAKAVAEVEAKGRKDQKQKDANAAIRMVSWYEKELGKVETKYRAEIDRVKRRAAKNEHKAAMEAALIVSDKAAKQADKTAKAHAEEIDKLDRKSQRKIQTLQRQMDREIRRLEQRAKALAVRLTPEGAEVDAVMSEFRRHRDKIYADKDAISTDILSAEEIQKRKKKAKAKHDNALNRMRDGFVRAFVTDTLDIERFSKLQERPDTADVRLTMYRNRGATTETIQQEFLISPDGDILDERSLASVALCWEHDKVGGKVDQPRQSLLQTYMYHRHGFDRMNVKNKAQAQLDAFLDAHPEFDVASGRSLAEGQKRLSRDDILLLQKNGDALAVEYVELCKQFSAAKNKPVMGDEKGHPVSAETHKAIADDLETNNPWLKEKADTIYEWWDKFMIAWVVGSELSMEQYTAMKELYPHYVPTYRAFDKSDRGVFVTDKNGMTVKKSIRAAKGSTMDLMSVDDSLAVQVAKIVENHRFNELAMNIIDEVLVEEHMSPEMFDYAVYDPYFKTNIDFRAKDMDNVSEDIEGAHGRIEKDGHSVKLTAWCNGEAVSVNISAGMARSLESLMGKNDRFEKLVKAGSVLTNPMKTAITGINPFFAARNVPRDQALAEVNSIAGPLGFPIYLNKAVYHMATGSMQWRQFKALGGTGSGYYNAESGFTKSLKGENWASKGLKKMGAFNEASEAMTRFAEYLATIDKVGDTAEGRALGIKNAAEVTVDFSRHGEYGKLLNAWIPYWNPAVQGMSRLVRSVMNEPDVVGKLKTLGKATAVSVLPEALLMGLLYAFGGYDEWEEFDDRSKDAYYLIPIGDGKAIKIAKSREWAQLIANLIMRAWQGLNGREDPFDHYWETSIAPNFGISTPLDAVGISQAVDLLTNKDFAGRTIIPKEFENVRPEDQYDEATSFLAKVLGKAFKISPMKIDYVIGDYFGDFGDILIEVANGNDSTMDFVKDLFTSPFVADSAYSNHINSEYYDMLDYFETELATMEVRDGETYKDSQLYSISQAINKYFKKPISELNKAVRETESEDESRRLKLEIRSIQQEALDFYESCMSGEIEDPVRYLEYAPYGDTVRNELIRLKDYEDSDYTFTPSTNAPKIGDHVNTDEEKSAFVDIYNSHFTSEIGSVISSDQYQKSSDDEKLSFLEGARELAYYYAKKEWATRYGIKSDSYNPETESHKFDTLIQSGLSYFDAYAIKEKYNEIRDSAEYSSNALRATAFAAWVDGQNNWSAEQMTMAKNSYKFTQTMVVGADKYDKLTGLGLSSDKSSAVVSIVSAVPPKDGETTVPDIRKWQAIVNSSDLSDSEKDKAIRAYMDSDNLAKYDACSRAGVTAREYVALRTTVNNLKPLKGNQSVTAGQKWDACVKAVSGDKKQDALLRSYMTDEQEGKYNSCRSSGVTASMYVEYYNAKYSYGDGNGSWNQEELEKWLRSKPWSNEQKSALWKSTNSGWKYNPFD